MRHFKYSTRISTHYFISELSVIQIDSYVFVLHRSAHSMSLAFVVSSVILNPNSFLNYANCECECSQISFSCIRKKCGARRKWENKVSSSLRTHNVVQHTTRRSHHTRENRARRIHFICWYDGTWNANSLNFRQRQSPKYVKCLALLRVCYSKRKRRKEKIQVKAAEAENLI